MSTRRLTFAVGLLATLLGCGPSGPSGPTLRPEEEVLVDLYVQITRIEAMRADAPDSVGPALDRLAHSHDSLGVRAALAGLEAEPERWETIYSEIIERLNAAEESLAPVPPPTQPAVPRLNAP